MSIFQGLEFFTNSGKIKIVTFKRFIDLVNVKYWPPQNDHLVWVERRPWYPFHKNPFTTEDFRVVEHFQSNYVALEDFIKSVEISDIVNTKGNDLIYMIDNMASHSAYEMGAPTHLFRLGKRLWALANPSDFEIHTNGIGSALTNYFPKKTIVWRVGK